MGVSAGASCVASEVSSNGVVEVLEVVPVVVPPVLAGNAIELLRFFYSVQQRIRVSFCAK